jgi:malate/lactate dehydrogenase
VELELTDAERSALHSSAESVRQNVQKAQEMLVRGNSSHP